VRRLLALVLLLAAAAAVASVTVLPVWLLDRGYDERIARAEQRLEALSRAAAVGAGLEARVEELRQRQAVDRRYLRSTSEALAGAELQGIVKQNALPRGGQVLSTQIVGSQQEEGFTRVTLKVKMKATLDKLVDILYAFETGTPYLFLDNVSIRSLGTRYRYRGAAAPPEQPLDVELEVSGYLRGEGA
jgi:general secretion pathway protein M